VPSGAAIFRIDINASGRGLHVTFASGGIGLTARPIYKSKINTYGSLEDSPAAFMPHNIL